MAKIGNVTCLEHWLWQMDYRTLMLFNVISATLRDSLALWGGPWQITRVAEFRGLFVLAEIPNTRE